MPVVTTRLPAAPKSIWRLSVDQYHAMIANGILTEDDRAELLDGILVEKMTKNPPHSVSTELIRGILESFSPAGWIVRAQEPVTLSESEPEPDAVLVRGSVRDFVARHPLPDEIGLVVEVADASLARDRGFKLQIYAKAKLPAYWIVNLIERQIEVYTSPTVGEFGPTYANRRDFCEGEEVAVDLGGREIGRIHVSDSLP